MSTLNLTNLFFFIAIISTLCFIIKAILYIMAGADIEISSDFTSITEHDSHFAYFSLETIFVFLNIFKKHSYNIVLLDLLISLKLGSKIIL